ncbi:MAG: glycosyltransferase family 4 protein [Bacteroidales bacterium]|jgi:glycosyltransferase involved in cell wall biosynthesis|nr:glycosyltransferase family 4 protein [Bacteroidales bacterium]
MKILLFDNSSITPRDGDYSCEPKTGQFATDLLELGNEITMYGQMVKAVDTIHVYKLKEKGIRVVGLYRRKNKLINYILLYLRAIPEVIKSDFVYVFYPNAFKYIICICILLRKKYGLYIRGQNSLNNKYSHYIYKRAYTVFTVSDFFSDFVNNISKKVIANTIRPMTPFNEKDILIDRDYQFKNKYRILYLGRVAFDKGIEELLQAIKTLKDKNYQFTLTIVGNGEFYQEAKKISDKLDINDIVFFNGSEFKPEKIRNYYIESDIYILPTYHEGFPRTLYEAMIFGTPIITTFVGGIPGLMKDGFNCKEIKPKSIESIVEKLEFAFNNYPEMIGYAKNGFNTVAKIVDSKRLSHAESLNKKINGQKS